MVSPGNIMVIKQLIIIVAFLKTGKQETGNGKSGNGEPGAGNQETGSRKFRTRGML